VIGQIWNYPNNHTIRFESDRTVTRLTDNKTFAHWFTISDNVIGIQYDKGHIDVMRFNDAWSSYDFVTLGNPRKTKIHSRHRMVDP